MASPCYANAAGEANVVIIGKHLLVTYEAQPNDGTEPKLSRCG
jgi:hypothetical protein